MINLKLMKNSKITIYWLTSTLLNLQKQPTLNKGKSNPKVDPDPKRLGSRIMKARIHADVLSLKSHLLFTPINSVKRGQYGLALLLVICMTENGLVPTKTDSAL